MTTVTKKFLISLALSLSLNISNVIAEGLKVVVDHNKDPIGYVTSKHFFDLDMIPIGYIFKDKVVLDSKRGDYQGVILKGILFDKHDTPVGYVLYGREHL